MLLHHLIKFPRWTTNWFLSILDLMEALEFLKHQAVIHLKGTQLRKTNDATRYAINVVDSHLTFPMRTSTINHRGLLLPDCNHLHLVVLTACFSDCRGNLWSFDSYATKRELTHVIPMLFGRVSRFSQLLKSNLIDEMAALL